MSEDGQHGTEIEETELGQCEKERMHSERDLEESSSVEPELH